MYCFALSIELLALLTILFLWEKVFIILISVDNIVSCFFNSIISLNEA